MRKTCKKPIKLNKKIKQKGRDQNFMSVKIEKINNDNELSINPNELVKVKLFIGKAELSTISRGRASDLAFDKLNDDEYMVKSTGEIKEFAKSKNRSEQIKSFKRSTKNLRDLINANFGGFSNEFMITLTYKDNMINPERLYSDFKYWKRKVVRRYGNFEHIVVREPQERGAWHMHALCKFKMGTKLDYKEVNELWEHGSFVNVKQLTNITNVGAYLSAYLGDVEVTEQSVTDCIENKEEIEILSKDVEINGEIVPKKFIKGGRIKYYPTGMQFYTKSRGIKPPVTYTTKKKQFLDEKKITESDNKTFSQVIRVSDEEKVLNTLKYENYAY